MKKLLFVLIILIPAVKVFSQEILWEHSYGGKHAEFLYDAIPTPDYGFLLAGSSISNKNGNKTDANKGDLDYWIWKMNEKGTPEWQKSFGGDGVDLLQSVQLTNDGGFILAGTSSSKLSGDKTENSKGQEDFWIIKLDGKGNQIWQRTIGGTGQEKLFSIAQTIDGGYILGGTSSSDKSFPDEKGVEDKYGKTEDSRGGLDYWVVKLNSKGEIQWQKTLGGKYTDELKSIHETQDKGYILGGYSNSPISGDKKQDCFRLNDYWIVKLDDQGYEVWQHTFGGDKDDTLFALIQTKDGGFMAGGSSNSGVSNSKSKANSKGTDFWILKLDKIGTIEWQETYNYGEKDILCSIVENPDGTFLIGGYAQSELKENSQKTMGKSLKSDKEGINDYIALKIKETGEEIWTQTVGSSGDEVMRKLFETRDGGYILAGTSKGQVSRDKQSAIGGGDFWVVKLRDKDKKEKERIALEAVPNPASNFTNVIITFEYNHGTAVLYDLSGRTLQTVQISGDRTVPIDMNVLPQGIYVIEVKTNTEKGGVKVIKK